jgi:hypothetical protein
MGWGIGESKVLTPVSPLGEGMKTTEITGNGKTISHTPLAGSFEKNSLARLDSLRSMGCGCMGENAWGPSRTCKRIAPDHRDLP